MLSKKRFINGVVLTAVSIVAALWITSSAFEKKTYYLAQLLPLFMAAYLLIAWVIYLRGDKVVTSKGSSLPAELQPAAATTATIKTDPFWQDSLYALLWSAVLLAVISILLYWCFGVGAKYY